MMYLSKATNDSLAKERAQVMIKREAIVDTDIAPRYSLPSLPEIRPHLLLDDILCLTFNPFDLIGNDLHSQFQE